ncbi:nuclear pore complex protein Nup214 isoform X2 [Hoplias malabaricus]|uniref:nuclear pore complex protein Nup214 isoform X2 n=1 Tax=Hoplias malabaricus TaxID=27720 RepID=UPI0034624F8F
MGDDPYPIPEREMKDFQFRQMKKIRVFDSPGDLPKERSSLLTISNRYGLTFVGQDRTLKVFTTQHIISAAKGDGNTNDIVEDVGCHVVFLDLPMHHLALSSDELTLSVCGTSEETGLTLNFYDVRTFLSKVSEEKKPFASFKPPRAADCSVQDLKWSPVEAFRLAVCLSDGRMMVLDVTNDISVFAQLPESVGITCVCWSPKGKQVAAGKQNATVVQYTPNLQEKKVIPCPNFYSADNPVKVLDVLWLSTFNFAVAYAAADGSPETPPELVVVSLPKKDEKREEKYMNFSDLVYGTCTERQHHYFLCHIEDWDLVLAASAASIEVSIISKQEDKTNWELWVLEDASRGELPVTQENDDTLPVGVAIDYTSQEEIHISDEKKLPPAPTLLILSTDGVLCPFSLLNMNSGAKQLVTAASKLPLDGERPPLPKSSVSPPAQAPAVSSLPSVFPSFQKPSATVSVAPAPVPAPVPAPAPAPSFSSSSSSFGFSFNLPPPASTAPPVFSFSSASSSAFTSSTSSSALTFPSSATSTFPSTTLSFLSSSTSSSSSSFPSTFASPSSTFPTTSTFSFAGPKPSTDAPAASTFSFTGSKPSTDVPAASTFSFAGPKPPTEAPAASTFSFASPKPSADTPAASTFSLAGPKPSTEAPAASTFSFAAPKPSTEAPASSNFSFVAPSINPPPERSGSLAPGAQRAATASPVTVLKPTAEPATPHVRMNLNERFQAVETPGAPPSTMQPFSHTSTPKLSAPNNSTQPPTAFSHNKPASIAVTRPVQSISSSTTAQKTPSAATQSISVKTLEKQLQQKKDSDPVMAGILEEIAHFQKEMDELKARSNRAEFRVGTSEEMRDLRKESEDLHGFTLEIKETTESLHGDISSLKTTLLEGFAGVEEARAQRELNKDKGYLQLLYKKPLDPRSDQQLKEIRKLYQYVKFAVEDVNDVLDLEWEKHLEKKKKQRHMIVPEREALYTALANNMDIINQQRQKLDQLTRDLQSLRLYNKTSAWSSQSRPASAPSSGGLDNELESLRDALLKASLETAPKGPSKSPSKMTPVKQSQLRNFLSKRQTPPIRSTAPANLSRSAFLSPKYYEDLDDVSSTSSLSQTLEAEGPHSVSEEENEEPPVVPVMMPRHPAVIRTTSIQPGLVLQSTPFSRVHTSLAPIGTPVVPKINMDSADSTALATKTVKHGPPPTEKTTPTERTTPTTIPATQAAARAALNRQMISQKPARPSLTESTLKTVPQVVNVQELKDKGPNLPVSTVISSSVPAPAAQVVQQVLATVEAKKNSSPAVKVAPPVTDSTPQSFVFGPKTDVPAASTSSSFPKQQNNKGFSFSTASPGVFPFALNSTSSQPPAPGGSQATPGSVIFNQPATSASVSAPVAPSFSSVTSSSSSSSSSTVAAFSSSSSAPAVAFGKDTEQASKFSFSSGAPKMPFSSSSPEIPFASKPATSASVQPPGTVEPISLTSTNTSFQTTKAQSSPWETLGPFSDLRVGQGVEGKETQKTAPGFTFGVPGNGGAAAFTFGSQPQAKPAPGNGSDSGAASGDVSKSSAPASSSVFQPAENAAPSATKPPPTAAAAATAAAPSFSSLLAAPLPSESQVSTKQSLAPASGSSPPPEPATTSATTPEEPASEPSIVPPAQSTPSPAFISQEPVASQPEIPAPSGEKPPTSQAPALTVTPTPPSSTTPPSEPVAAVEASQPEPKPTSTPTTAAGNSNLEQAPPPIATTQAPTSTTPGSIFASTTAGTTLSVTSFTPVVSTATLAAPSSTVVAPLTTSTTAQAPAPIFGQTATTTSAPAFGSSTFGAASTTQGFGKPVFGQVSSNGFGQPPAASGFTFGQSAFGTSSAFGQTPNPAASAPASSAGGGGGGLFGSSSTSSASSFSFGASTSSTPSAGTNIFGQSSAPVFGQQSGGFGQGSLFGGGTTTTTSSGFGFGQPAAFGSTPSPSVFGQQPSSGSVFGQSSSAGGSLFGSGAANAPSAGSGFFSGLGGKPSEDAANKNPFGATTTGAFGQANQTGSTSLFGNSGAKNFGFGTSSFGEQKPSGTFTAGGGGSVAAQGFGSFSTPSKTGGFGAAPVFGSPPAFGGSPAFGSSAAFGSSPSFNSPIGASPGKVFGEGTAAANVGGFGFASPQSAPSFGSLASQSSAPSFGAMTQQTPTFGAPTSGFSAFGSSSGGFGGFGNTNTNQSSNQTFSGWRS